MCEDERYLEAPAGADDHRWHLHEGASEAGGRSTDLTGTVTVNSTEFDVELGVGGEHCRLCGHNPLVTNDDPRVTGGSNASWQTENLGHRNCTVQCVGGF